MYDRAYFRQKMAESRKHQQKQHRREGESRAIRAIDATSVEWAPPAIALDTVPGLSDVLDSLTNDAQQGMHAWLNMAQNLHGFDLGHYESHIEAHMQPFETCFEDIPVLLADRPRLDRIWRFIAVIFLAHNGRLSIYQENNEIWVRSHNEINRERPRVSDHAGRAHA